MSVMMETNPHKWLTCLDESNPMVQSQCLCGGRDDGRERNSLGKAVVMGLLSLVEQPARYDSGMIALQKIKRLIGTFVFGTANLHDYGDSSIIESLWSELGMPKSLSFVPRE